MHPPGCMYILLINSYPCYGRAIFSKNDLSNSSARLPSKRKPGPLPRDFVAQRPRSTEPSPPDSPSPVPWLNRSPDSEVFVFEEKPSPANNSNVVVVNGTDCNERSRSPSPEPELSNDSNYLPRNVEGFAAVSGDTGNSIFNANYLMSDDKQISQILKEANSMNSMHQNNVQENKVKVSVFG